MSPHHHRHPRRIWRGPFPPTRNDTPQTCRCGAVAAAVGGGAWALHGPLTHHTGCTSAAAPGAGPAGGAQGSRPPWTACPALPWRQGPKRMRRTHTRTHTRACACPQTQAFLARRLGYVEICWNGRIEPCFFRLTPEVMSHPAGRATPVPRELAQGGAPAAWGGCPPPCNAATASSPRRPTPLRPPPPRSLPLRPLQCSDLVTSSVWCTAALDRLNDTVSPDSRAFPTVKAAELVDVLEVCGGGRRRPGGGGTERAWSGAMAGGVLCWRGGRGGWARRDVARWGGGEGRSGGLHRRAWPHGGLP